MRYYRSYYAVIKTGNISMRVALDTASSDLWIVSSSCETNTCTKIPRYPLTYESPTFVVMNDNKTTFVAQYADTTCM
jgi:Eukaryotic aspartyl protease